MNVKQKNIFMKILSVLISVFVFLGLASAQTDTKSSLTDQEINELSSQLGMKILLSDNQIKSVENLLKNYRSELSKVMSASVEEAQNKIISATNAQIVALLDSKQQMKFNVIGTDWWDSVKEATNN